MTSLAFTAGAQESGTKTSETITTRLDQIEAALGAEGQSDIQLNKFRSELVEIQSEAVTKRDELQPKLQKAKVQLDALQPAEASEEKLPESEHGALIQRREELSRQVAEMDAEFKLISASLVRVAQLNNTITLARQNRFTTQLFERSGSLSSPSLWTKGLSGLAVTWKATLSMGEDWFAYLEGHASDKIGQVAFMILLAAIMIFGPVRFAMVSGISRLARLEQPTPLQKSLHATWSVLVYTLVPFLCLLAVVLIMDNAELLPVRIQRLSNLLGSVLFVSALSYGLIRVLLAPRKPAYRLLNLDNGSASRVYRVAMMLLAVFVIESLFDKSSTVLFIPLETTILIRGVTAVLIGILIWFGLRLVISSRPADILEDGQEATQSPESFSLPGFIRVLQPLIWLGCVPVVLAPLFGYVSFGGFIAEQMGRVFLILALLGIMTALVDNLLMESLDVKKESTQSISRAMGIQPKTIGQFSVLLNGVMRILLYIAATLLIFAPWGVQSSDFLTTLQSAIFNIKIGDLNISPINIIGAVIVFIIALVLVKSIQHWVEKRLMPATSLDTGLKNSIQTSVGYVGFIIAAMLAFSYMGLDLSNIALVAGALSVGIGFGLQSIVNNFVSGLILLVERPIKTGDWVVVGADQGYVKKISVRATKIETFDRATVIVPNSELISNRVMNWMHNGSLGRVIIPVGVSYDADPEQVKEILLRIAQESEYVVSYPGPNVYFMDFGASSLDFELRCYIQDIDYSLSAKSAMRFAIFKALKEANIEIPFPQQDIHVRSFNPSQAPEEIPTRPAEITKSRTEPRPDEIDLDADGQGEGEGNGSST